MGMNDDIDYIHHMNEIECYEMKFTTLMKIGTTQKKMIKLDFQNQLTLMKNIKPQYGLKKTCPKNTMTNIWMKFSQKC